MRRSELADRVRGCILAGAIGDAMGGPFEGQRGPVGVPADWSGTISDDTQLTLATCESAIAAGGVRPERVANAMVSWYRAGRITGIGASTLKALRDLDGGVHWALAGAKGEMSAGNGAAMRIAPLAFLLDPAVSQDRQTLRDVCRITHHHDEAYVGALAVVMGVRIAAFGRGPRMSGIAGAVAADLPDSRVRERLQTLAATTGTRPRELGRQFGCSGYVVESVPLALYCASLIEGHSLREVLISAVEAGGDTDTIGSIAGQIAGTYVGETSIDGGDLRRVRGIEEVSKIASDFAEVASRWAAAASP